MRTNIIINDELMNEALKASGLNTKKAVVKEGLRLVIALKKQQRIKSFRGKLSWEGDLGQSRTDV